MAIGSINDGSCIRLRPLYRGHVWSYDFVASRTHDGRALKLLTVLDEHTRECLAIVVARKIRSHDVLEVLADTGDARRILFGGHAMRDEGTDSTAHFSVCGNPESWSTAPGPDFIEHQLAHAVRESQRPGLQPDGVPVRTQGNDAGLGRLSGPAQGW